MQDYGAPVGFRIMQAHPERVRMLTLTVTLAISFLLSCYFVYKSFTIKH